MLEDELRDELEDFRKDCNRNQTISRSVEDFMNRRNYDNLNRLMYNLIENGIRGILVDYTAFLLDKRDWQPGEKERYKNNYDEYLNRSISSFELSYRVINGLESVNIRTVRDLIERNERDIMRIRNLGRCSWREIREIILEPMDLEYMK